jgi:hypothetical protein
VRIWQTIDSIGDTQAVVRPLPTYSAHLCAEAGIDETKTRSVIVLDTKAYFMVTILIMCKVMKFALTALSRDDNFCCGIE